MGDVIQFRTSARGYLVGSQPPELFVAKPMNVTPDKLPPAYPKDRARPSVWKRVCAAVNRWFEQQWCPHWKCDAGRCMGCGKKF